MKQKALLFLTSLLTVFAINAQSICNEWPDENGNYSGEHIKEGTVTWDEENHVLTLDHAVIVCDDESHSQTPLLRITEDATINVIGDCRLSTLAYEALNFYAYTPYEVTISGRGSLTIDSGWVPVFLGCCHLTFKDITFTTNGSIANNANGYGVGLNFDNVKARIEGGIYRIGDGVTFNNCHITDPPDATFFLMEGSGYFIEDGHGNDVDYVVIMPDSYGGTGDVNCDSEISLSDINALINMILGDKLWFYGDVNNDYEVSLSDINALIDIILTEDNGEMPED